MTDKKKKRVGVLAILLLFLLLGGGFFIYTEERPELFIPKDEIITRGEFAAILVRDIPLDTVDAKKDTASFPDTRGHWSEKYIEALINAGIIDPADYPDGFKPDETITRAEIIKMPSGSFGLGNQSRRIPFNKALRLAQKIRLLIT